MSAARDGNSSTATAPPMRQPTSCAGKKAKAEAGAIPAKVSLKIRPTVTAGLAKLADDVKKQAAAMYDATATGLTRWLPLRARAKITSTRPAVATTSPARWAALSLSVLLIETGLRPKIALATTTPAMAPTNCAGT